MPKSKRCRCSRLSGNATQIVTFGLPGGRVAFQRLWARCNGIRDGLGYPPLGQDSSWKLIRFSWMRRMRRGNFMILFWLRVDYWQQTGYAYSLPALFEAIGQ